MNKDTFNDNPNIDSIVSQSFDDFLAELSLDELLSDSPTKLETPVKKPVPQKPAARPATPAQGTKPPVRREGAPVKKEGVPAKKPAPQKTSAPTAKPQTAKSAPQKAAPAPMAPVKQPVEKKKKGPRLGGVIFYTLYFLFILVFFVATYFGLNWLKGWLTDYEAAQPTVKAQQVFTQLFTDPDWGALYDASGAQDSAYEGKEEFVTYMENQIGDAQLTYLETSAGLSDDKKYVVRLGNEKVATFTLVDKNALGETTLEDFGGELPDWQLGAVEVFFEREESYFVQKMDGHTVYVNDVALTDDHTIQIATTVAEKYLPAGTTGASICTQQVTGLMQLPTVTVFDENGNQMEVTYDEASRTFIEKSSINTMSAEEEELALKAAQVFCLWMIEEGNRADIAKYYDTSSQVYNDIIRTTELWMQNHKGYEFINQSVTNYARYSEDIFSVRVSMDLSVTRTDGSVKAYPYAASLFFRNTNKGWKVFSTTNVDVSQPVGKVRLTFMYNDQVIQSEFFETDAKSVITPDISPLPANKVLAGWATQTTNENGDTVMTIVFQPDETSKVSLPDGNVLEPMVLYPVFQDASAAADISEAADTAEGGE